MGGGYSTFADRQKHAYLRRERRRKRAIRLAERKVWQAQRTAWVRSQQAGVEEFRWWSIEWWLQNGISAPLDWWRLRKAWERERGRKVTGTTGGGGDDDALPDQELAHLATADFSQPAVEGADLESVKASDVEHFQSGANLRKRK